jgi:hypothetical protein
MLCPSYCLYSLFNKIKDKDRMVSAWKARGWGEREGMWQGKAGVRDGVGGRGRNDPNIVCTYK